MVGIPRGRLGVGGKFISTFIDSMGNAGKIVDADDIDALDAFVDARVTTTSGEGSKVFVVTASYNASTGVLRFGSFRGGFPSTIAVGDVVVFVSPSNIEDDQDITVDDQVNATDRNLYDIDGIVVQGRQLSPGRLYWAQRLFVGLNEAYHLALPLGVYQITPAQTANVTITNAQLKAIDQAPVELIPAPGAGKAIEIMSISRTPSGADRPDFDDTESYPTPDTASVANTGRLLYGYVTDDSADPPYTFGENFSMPRSSNELEVLSDEGFVSILYAEDQTFFEIIGHQFLQENEAFVLALAIQGTRNSLSFFYSEAEFDNLMTPANDNTLEVVVQYLIHDF